MFIYFQKRFPTCHLLSSEGIRMADRGGAPRSPSIIHKAQQGHQHSRDRDTALKTACQVSSPWWQACTVQRVRMVGAILATGGSRQMAIGLWFWADRQQSGCRGGRPDSQGKLTVAHTPC